MSTDLPRLIAACINAPRFRGRAAIIELAQGGDLSALHVLEADGKDRTILALRGVLSKAVVAALKLPEINLQKQKRLERDRLRKKKDPLALRRSGNVVVRAAKAALHKALNEARFRGATHAHEVTIRYSETAYGAESCSDKARPSKVGLPNAYSRKGYFVATSTHAFMVSPAILKIPQGKRWDGKHLWLAPDCRVRQGRGTSLVCERKEGRRWVPHRLQMSLALVEPPMLLRGRPNP